MKLLITVGVLLILVTNLTMLISADKKDSASLSILDAYYCDLDNDGREDDIYAEALLTKEFKKGIVYLDIEFVYPSNDTFTDTHIYQSKNEYEILFKFYFWNGALEEGWYTFNLGAEVEYKYHSTTLFDSLIFDPPGGSDGEDPEITTDP